MAGLLAADVTEPDVAQQDRAAGVDIGRSRRVNGADGPQEHDAEDERRQVIGHQERHHVAVLGELQYPGDLQDPGAHALDRGEIEQGEADHEGGHEGLLPGQGLGAFDPEELHGEGRGGLDAHEREHVGQAHHGRPGHLPLGAAPAPQCTSPAGTSRYRRIQLVHGSGR